MAGTDYLDLLAAAAYQAGGKIVINDKTLLSVGPGTDVRITRLEATMQTVVELVGVATRKPYVEPGEFRDVSDDRALPKPLARLSRD